MDADDHLSLDIDDIHGIVNICKSSDILNDGFHISYPLQEPTLINAYNENC